MLHLDRLVSAPRAPINEPQKAKLEIYFRETKSRSKSDLAAMPCMDFTTWDPKIIGCNDLEIISNLIYLILKSQNIHMVGFSPHIGDTKGWKVVKYK